MLDGATLTDALSNTSQQPPSVTHWRNSGTRKQLTAQNMAGPAECHVAVTVGHQTAFTAAFGTTMRNDAFDAAKRIYASGQRGRNEALAASNQFGGALGGPFFFPGYNGRNRPSSLSVTRGFESSARHSAYYSLTAAERTGDFSDLLPGRPSRIQHGSALPR